MFKWLDVPIEEARYRQIPEAIYEASRHIGQFNVATRRLEYLTNQDSPLIASLRYRGYLFKVSLALPKYAIVHKIVELAKAIDTELTDEDISRQQASDKLLTDQLIQRIEERNQLRDGV